ncbi:MAG: 50S ribosomal protein L13 [Nitrospirae bacterium]|nr:50S ribosomal protein L13 [Nitrospirota bacterium]
MKDETAWHLVDADGKVVGRLASRVAQILRGKHKATFSPHLVEGDHVVIVNAEKVRFTGDKWNAKEYRHHSGYPRGYKAVNAETMRKRHPERILLEAVSGMLPKNKLRKVMMSHLKVYAGPSHPHSAQQPKPLAL